MSLYHDLSDMEYPFAGDQCDDEETVPEWIGPHCPVCLDTLADSDAVRCFSCNKRQHKSCAVLVVEDLYCRESCALTAALVALKDAAEERDTYKAALIRTVALGDVSAAIEGLVATNATVTWGQVMEASIEMRKTA